MSAVINRQLSPEIKNISVITLMAFLLAFFLHSQHISKPQAEQSTIDAYQDCHICQQGMDSAPNPLPLTVTFRENFALVNKLFIANINSKTAYIIPQLRAPPSFW